MNFAQCGWNGNNGHPALFHAVREYKVDRGNAPAKSVQESQRKNVNVALPENALSGQNGVRGRAAVTPVVSEPNRVTENAKLWMAIMYPATVSVMHMNRWTAFNSHVVSGANGLAGAIVIANVMEVK